MARAPTATLRNDRCTWLDEARALDSATGCGLAHTLDGIRAHAGTITVNNIPRAGLP
jgi:hypothetical protein